MKKTINYDEVTAKGLVLKKQRYKEKDALLTIYFKEYGKLTLHARGIMGPKSKNASSCEALCMSEFTFILRKGICTLIRSVYCTSYATYDLEYEAMASLLCEYYLKYIGENEPSLEEYQFLIQTFTYIKQKYHRDLIYVFMLAMILKRNGTFPEVDGCVICGSTKNIRGVSIKHGGFCCIEHFGMDDLWMSKGAIKLLRQIIKAPIEALPKISFEAQDLQMVKHYLDDFYDTYSDLNLKSKRFCTLIVG